MTGQSQAEIDDEGRELLQFAALMTRAIVDEVREASLWPVAGEWARAQALREAREWVESLDGILFGSERLSGAQAQRMVETLAERWSDWIESGVMPEGDER